MTPPEHRSGYRTPLAAAWAVVVLLHIILGWLLMRASPARHALEAAPPRVSVRLLPWITVAPEPEPKEAPRPAFRVAAPPARAPTITPPSRSGPTTTTATAPVGAAAPAEPAASQAEHQAKRQSERQAEHQRERPLDLTVRPSLAAPAVRAQALSDPRANSRLTPEPRMAQTLGGDGSLAEESLGDGRRRFRQNGKCFQATPSRASQLNPYSGLPGPNLIGEC